MQYFKLFNGFGDLTCNRVARQAVMRIALRYKAQRSPNKNVG